ncbi:transcription factor MYBS1-like [Salvia divinorum]|uniref:Transcription factor MYBS1-like n=1 Tax=Salvia divinorum TaxID=28513 RepID=A0ABD1GC74_SALDI
MSGGWSGGGWSREEEKAFEDGIAMHWNEECKEQSWTKIASMVPTKSILELKHHYMLLLEDVAAIEAGNVPLSNYNTTIAAASSSTTTYKDPFHHKDKPFSSPSFSPVEPSASRSDQERRKGIPWTEEEHRLFLLGLDKYGKGDWRSISRNYVISRTPTQVASHAQKYFIRLNSINRDRRRSSIHDITGVNGEAPSSAHPAAPHVTGQHAHPPPAAPPAMKHHQIQRPNLHGLGMYGGAPVGQPVAVPPGRHMASAVGTPVMMPPGHHHPSYVLPVGCPVPPPPPPHIN